MIVKHIIDVKVMMHDFPNHMSLINVCVMDVMVYDPFMSESV